VEYNRQWFLKTSINVSTTGWGWIPLFEHDKSIPDSVNSLVERALRFKGIEYLWFLEEDMAPEEETLTELLIEMTEEGLDVCAVDYNLRGGCPSMMVSSSGKVLWAGLGCILVRTGVFHIIGKPYFRTEATYTVAGEHLKYTGRWDRRYGGHDIDFFARCDQARLRIGKIDRRCPHFELKGLGKPDDNHGCHDIREIK